MWSKAKQARMDEIHDELGLMLRTKNFSSGEMDKLVTEGERLVTERDNYQKAKGMGSYASPSEYGMAGTNPGDDNGFAFKGFGPGMEHQIRPMSMYALDKSQIAALQQAGRQGTGFRVQLGSKGIEHGFMGGQIRSKAAVTEGGLTPNLLPPIQQVGPLGFWGLPYELTRVANFLTPVAMDGPGIAYFQHTGNSVEAAYTAEGATKPDLTPTITETYVKPAKVAGRVNLTHELLQDAGDAFANNLVSELARSVYNAESNLLLNGTSGANGFNGINQVSGTLTTALDTGTDEVPLDTINRAIVALRNDYFIPDLCFIHPSTMGALRRYKDANNRYQLELLQGARSISQTSEQEELWGVPVVQTTQQAAGTAAMLSIQSGAAILYIRENLSTFFDPYSQAASNIYQYIAETRIALATPRPGAINLISGLPTS